MDFLKGLKPENTDHEVGLYHASPRDPVWEYVLAVDQARECIAEQDGRVSLIGHSHVALWFSDGPGPPGNDGGGQAEDGRELDVSEGKWLLNPGSVGQPRDGDPRAAYAVLDLALGSVTFHRSTYRIHETQRRIRERGLPSIFADRLDFGF
jgi:diadenosine tetraphosphatase ApaH/serine/threonine PP2A family protein phosphatase